MAKELAVRVHSCLTSSSFTKGLTACSIRSGHSADLSCASASTVSAQGSHLWRTPSPTGSGMASGDLEPKKKKKKPPPNRLARAKGIGTAVQYRCGTTSVLPADELDSRRLKKFGMMSLLVLPLLPLLPTSSKKIELDP